MGLNFLRSKDSVYERAVQETAFDADILFVDPTVLEKKLKDFGADAKTLASSAEVKAFLSTLTDEQKAELGETYQQHLEDQLPGTAQAMLENFSDIDNYTDLATDALTRGPAAISNVEINGNQYGIVYKPNEAFDTKNDIVNTFLSGNTHSESSESQTAIDLSPEEIENIVDNMPGSNREWVSTIGYHEGNHIFTRSFEVQPNIGNPASTLASEASADRAAYYQATYRNDSDVALAFRDLRALSGNDPSHATGPLMDSGDPASYLHLRAASDYQGIMLGAVDNKYDFDAHEGSATNAQELLREDPDAFFETLNGHMEEIRGNVLDEYNQNPQEYETTMVVVGQIYTDYMNDFEDAYRRRVLGEDVPERMTSTQLIPQELEHQHYRDIDQSFGIGHPKYTPDEPDNIIGSTQEIDYEEGPNGTPYTTNVSGIETGEPTVDFETGVSVNGTSMPNVFGQSAAPATENITVVDPTQSEISAETPAMITPQTEVAVATGARL